MLGKTYFFLLFVSFFITGCGIEEVSSIDAEGVGSENTGTEEVDSGNTRAVRVSWSMPVTYENGTPLNDLTGYKIYYNTSPDKVFLNDVVVNQPGITAYTLSDLEPDSWLYVVITAINSKNVESQVSEVVNIYISS